MHSTVLFNKNIIAGTVYIQTTDAANIVRAMAIFTWGSGLWIFPAIQVFYIPALKLFGYEKANRVGKARDVVIQGFIRYITIVFIPIVVSGSLLYLLVSHNKCTYKINTCSAVIIIQVLTRYSLQAYVQVMVTNICLSLTWTALLTALLTTFRESAFRVSSIVSAVAAFTSGFYIPIGSMNWA